MEITVFWEALCTHGRGALSRFKNLTLLLDKHGKIRDFLPEQPILMIKMFSSPMDQVLQGGIQREPCPYPRCSRSSSDTCPLNPAPQVRACAVLQAGRPAATLGPTPRMGSADESMHCPSGRAASSHAGPYTPDGDCRVLRGTCLDATGMHRVPTTRAPPSTSCSRRRWALPLPAQ